MAKVKNNPAPLPVQRRRKNIDLLKVEALKEPQSIYMSREAIDVLSFIGLPLKQNAGLSDSGTFLIDLIRKGIPKNAIDRLIDKIGFSEDELAYVLHISKRTLQRRTPREVLNPEQSERIIELSKLYRKGEEVFNGLDLFKEWMNSDILSLGNKKPKEYLDTSIGISILMDELGRIEHGIYS